MLSPISLQCFFSTSLDPLLYTKMPILFIAVKCVQCSTMQVKQQKKTSNRWVCAVCNQRQSVLRIYARGFIARDLRKFVQEFNLSRMNQESGVSISFSPPSDRYFTGSETGSHTASMSSKPVTPAKQRTDWSEYLDPEEYDQGTDDGEALDSEILLGGDLMTRLPRKRLNHPSKKQPATAERKKALEKFSRNVDLHYEGTCPKESSSRWSEYLDEEEEKECSMPSGEDSSSDLLPFETDRRVEDEMHPDFL